MVKVSLQAILEEDKTTRVISIRPWVPSLHELLGESFDNLGGTSFLLGNFQPVSDVIPLAFHAIADRVKSEEINEPSFSFVERGIGVAHEF